MAKRTFICFRVADMNPGHAGNDLATANCKIFINEAISSFQFKRFFALKEVVKGNGFEYIWHSCGQFLGRWRKGGSVHVFSSVEDQSMILKAYRAPV